MTLTKKKVPARARVKRKTKPGPPKGSPQKGGGPARSPEEVAVRRKTIEALMLEGYVGDDLVEELTKRLGKSYPWNTVRKDILNVIHAWEEADAAERQALRARQRRQLYSAARELREKKFWGTWCRVQELISRIDGTQAPVRFEHRDVDEFEDWTTEELDHYAKTGEAPARLFAIARGKSGSVRRSDRSTKVKHTIH